MIFKSLIELLINSFIPKEDIIPLFTNFSEIEKIINFKNLKKYEYIYLNKENIHKILYDNETNIKIQSNIPEKNLGFLFYIILLIKYNPYIVNYIYEFNYIDNLNNYRKKCNNTLNNFILSLIIIELINNFRVADEVYDDIYENKLEIIYDENEKIKNDEIILNEYHLDKNDIKSNNIEEIYIKIIISLIKEEKLKDYEFSTNIFNQLDLQFINITQKMYEKLISIFNINNNYIQKYIISKIEDLYDEEKINFYFIILKYIFKNSIYIYDVPILLNTRNIIIKLIKSDLEKFSEININNNHLKEKIDFVIKILCNSDYYYNKYLDSKNIKIKQILKYYKSFFFVSKKSDIMLLEKSINNLNAEIEYIKYYKDLENAKKYNARTPLIYYLLEKDELNDNDEDDINECIMKWDELEKAIKNKKIKKMRRDYKEMLKNYFNNNYNKNILLNIFSKNEYKYFINEVNEYSKIDNKNIEENNYYDNSELSKEISKIKVNENDFNSTDEISHKTIK